MNKQKIVKCHPARLCELAKMIESLNDINDCDKCDMKHYITLYLPYRSDEYVNKLNDLIDEYNCISNIKLE